MTKCTDQTAIGVDIGGSHISALLLDDQGGIVRRIDRAVEDRSLRAVVGLIRSCVTDLRPQFAGVKGIGISVPGNVNVSEGVTRYLPNFGWLEPVALAAMIEDDFALPVQLLNDGRAAAIANRPSVPVAL